MTDGPSTAAADPPASPGHGGRPRDASRDADILDAALDVLAEVGYAGLTMDMVAARARAGKGTVYRRWSSKEDLIIDAVTRMKRTHVDLANLPDTGTLRGDLVALIRPVGDAETERRFRVMTGVTSLLSQHPALADVIHAAVHDPWYEAHHALMGRARDRGEISPTAAIEEVASVMPTMAAYRVLILRRPVDRPYLLGLVDGLVLPALGLAGAGAPGIDSPGIDSPRADLPVTKPPPAPGTG